MRTQFHSLLKYSSVDFNSFLKGRLEKCIPAPYEFAILFVMFLIDKKLRIVNVLFVWLKGEKKVSERKKKVRKN